MQTMTIEQKCDRLENMLQYAASKADNLKMLLSKYCDDDGKLIPAETARFRREKRDTFDKRLKAARATINRLQEASLAAAAQRDSANMRVSDLQAELEETVRARDEAEARSESMNGDIDALEAKLSEADSRIAELSGKVDELKTYVEETARAQAAAPQEEAAAAPSPEELRFISDHELESEVVSFLLDTEDDVRDDPVVESYLRFLKSEEASEAPNEVDS